MVADARLRAVDDDHDEFGLRTFQNLDNYPVHELQKKYEDENNLGIGVILTIFIFLILAFSFSEIRNSVSIFMMLNGVQRAAVDRVPGAAGVVLLASGADSGFAAARLRRNPGHRCRQIGRG